jgi:type IV pilus assembly protein PilB
LTLDEIDDDLLSIIGKVDEVDDDQLNRLIQKAEESDHTVAYHASRMELVDDYDLRGYLEQVTGYEAFDPTYIDWEDDDYENYTRLLPEGMLREHTIFPVNKQDNEVGVILLNPTDDELVRRIQARTGCRVHRYVSHEAAFEKAFEMNLRDEEQTTTPAVDFESNGYCFEQLDSLRQEVSRLVNSTDEWRTDDDVFLNLLHETPVLLLTQEIMNRMMVEGGSDIHFETMEDHFRVRLRRDGELRIKWEFPKSFAPVILGRIRLSSDLNPRPQDHPQDARIGYTIIHDSRIEYRVSTLPTLHGEKIVLRTIDLEEGTIPLDGMGYSDRDLSVLRKGIHQPTGMVLITGPTGSGKTTTLYSVVEERNEESVSITTAEDPVEAQLEDVAQVSCSEEEGAGITFNEALKSFLRQDPDIILVGEIRDRETGEIAIEAAMTGHLLLSTLHTNSAAESVNRLVNMEIPPYLIAAGLSVVVAQRLIRTLCEECKEETDPPTETFNRFDIDPDRFPDTTFYDAPGCQHCDEGFSGRTGIFEVMEIDDHIREGIFNGESTDEIQERAREQGFTTLLEDGFRKVRNGVTTLEEVMRNTV